MNEHRHMTTQSRKYYSTDKAETWKIDAILVWVPLEALPETGVQVQVVDLEGDPQEYW